MIAALARNDIEAAFLAACHAELDAIKPGNVHRASSGHGMDVTHFERAAEAAAPFIADPALSVGERILGATRASVEASGVNTNLGIVLLCAPLAKAAAETSFDLGLRRRLGAILAQLDERDGDDAFAAIRIASPAGLGKVGDGDVNAASPHLTLIMTMHLAADRDRIANAYVTVFSDVFDFALPVLKEARDRMPEGTLAVTALHMTLLAEFPDTHIQRKYGSETAEDVRRRAAALNLKWQTEPKTTALQSLLEFDASLKSDRLNPGTTADFVVATLFVERLLQRKHAS